MDTISLDICDLPSETGPCKAYISSYLIVGDVNALYNYGGCGGNENRFKTFAECEQKCGTTLINFLL